jgi:hypothetical protein
MTDNSMRVQQPSHMPVPPHPLADDRGIAPANRVGPGGAGNNTAPQPAAREQKLLVPGQAKDTKAAEEQAETDSVALAEAMVNVGNLILNDATPAEISNAKHAANIAQGKAENATRDNVIAQREHKEQRSAIRELVGTELTKLEQEVYHNPYPSSSTLTSLEATADRFSQASKDYEESRASLVHAEKMLHAVAGVPMFPSTDAATEKYPNLVIAEGKFFRALDRLGTVGDSKDVVKQHLGQAQKAAVDLRTAWARARTDANKGHDTRLKHACDVGFGIADANVQTVTNPDFVKAQESR